MKERIFPDRPLLGVGGLIFQDDQVLLIKRGREPGIGHWSIPGGMVEVGESVSMAVQREVLEETGLKVEAQDLVKIFERIIPDEEGRIQYHYVVLDYLCRVVGGLLSASSDAEEAYFYSMQDLDRLRLLPETEQVIRQGYLIFQSQNTPGPSDLNI
jgi:8-oxo-dGTP diphosphatase